MRYSITYIIEYTYDLYSDKPLTDEEVVENGLDLLEEDTNSTWYYDYYIEKEED